MGINRLTRVNQLLRRELGLAFEKYICPAMPGVLITVTGVEITQELKDAKVYVSIYGNERQQEAAMALVQKKRALLQSEIASNVILRFTPRLQFIQDRTAERAERVMNIISELGLDADEKKTAEQAAAQPGNHPENQKE